ncbi:hypothetical protein [Amycolatopsis sp. SID8362]|uniref:hypothetical protein n=1 Tax=Amycolatopsis sp. SID8362 TaxID=2690346 RepID=UPI0013686574|nr:hypothetical protein [Amycolatopsis sp. SID8362]NBH02906.1 hypothetical protein [Amycolatopsis sp. SID8362]NED39607.1 hypothetical protein [Amycolatopsis sp. SID8362]
MTANFVDVRFEVHPAQKPSEVFAVLRHEGGGSGSPAAAQGVPGRVQSGRIQGMRNRTAQPVGESADLFGDFAFR